MTEQPSSDQAQAAPEFSSTAAAQRAGVTYRQVDYWRRAGLINPLNPDAEGSGNPLRWSLAEVLVIERIGVLVGQGLEPGTAALVARRAQHARLMIRLIAQDAKPVRLPGACPDGGECDSGCALACRRVLQGAPPAAGMYGGDAWPAWLAMREHALDSSEHAAALHGTVGD